MLKSLTSFRFFAAFMVFCTHAGLLKNYSTGVIGVSFFFVLSGFILTYNYHSKFTILTKNQIKKFYVARFSKIYPVHFLTFFISIPLALKLIGELPLIKILAAAFLNIFLLQGYFPKEWIFFSFNGVSWSLSNEFFFYGFFPFLIWMFLKIKKFNPLYLLILVFSIYLILAIGISINNVKTVAIWMLYIFPVLRILDFIMGIILGILFVQIKEKIKLNIWFFTLLECLSIIMLFLFIIISPNINLGVRISAFYLPVWSILIVTFAFQSGHLSRLISNRILVYLGEVSFAFYMVHELVLRYFTAYVDLNQGLTFLAFLASLLFSSIVYHFYEEPLRKKIRFGKNKSSKKTLQKKASA